jgi:hypothetical protein
MKGVRCKVILTVFGFLYGAVSHEIAYISAYRILLENLKGRYNLRELGIDERYLNGA